MTLSMELLHFYYSTDLQLDAAEVRWPASRAPGYRLSYYVPVVLAAARSGGKGPGGLIGLLSPRAIHTPTV